MAITGTLTKDSAPTTAGTVTGDNSLGHVSGPFEGFVILQVAPTGTTDFVNIINFDPNTSLPIVTPDSTALYRFVSKVTSGTATVYLGA